MLEFLQGDDGHRPEHLVHPFTDGTDKLTPE